MYNIDYRAFIKRNLPRALRGTKLMDWIYALLKPLRTIDDEFTELREEIRFEYKWNGLKHSLEWQLNDKYDPLLRRIYINVVDKIPVLFIKSDGEQPDAYIQDGGALPDYYIWNPDAINSTLQVNYEFKVMVHQAISFNPNEMLQILRIYRFGGLRPAIFNYGIDGEVEIETTYETISLNG